MFSLTNASEGEMLYHQDERDIFSITSRDKEFIKVLSTGHTTKSVFFQGP